MYQHFVEWMKSSVDPSTIKYNVTWLENDNPYQHLFEGLPDSERRNDGRVRDYWLNKYKHINQGGWWCAGENILTGERSSWGCFKPVTPRTDKSHKIVKYEHPPKVSTEIFTLRIDRERERAIYERAGVTVERTASSFWQHVRTDTRIPLFITEGAKKTGCLMSAGFAGIGLPGVNNGVRRNKNQWGEYIGVPYLIPHLAAFDWQGRDCFLCFDRDTKPKSVRAVHAALRQLGKLLEAAGANVRVVLWDATWKGVDDLISANGVEAFERAITMAIPLQDFRLCYLKDLSRYVTRRLCQPFISDLEISPDTQLLCLKSSKGTGKTELIARLTNEANSKGTRVLVNTHRIQLSQNLAIRIGIDYVTERHTSLLRGVLGYAMCIDSLHQNSGARFNVEDWDGAIVVIDEVEQVLWHLLSSTTCKQVRTTILQNLRALLRHVIATNGKIIIADADLTTISLKFIENLIGERIKVEVIENQWTPPSRDLTAYEKPEFLWHSLTQTLAAGKRVMVHCSAQKTGSLWSSQNIEKRILEQFPQLRVLRLDSESIADPNHSAYGCMGDINTVVQGYDVVVASPALETGASIDVRGHFHQVYGFYNGVQTTDSVCQSLARVREPVPRHVFIAKRGLNLIGGGACTPKEITNALDAQTRATIKVLRDGSESSVLDELDTAFMPDAVQAWAQRAALVNVGCLRYRETILRKLEEEGYVIAAAASANTDTLAPVRDEMRVSRTELQEKHWENVAAAASPTNSEYEKLKNKRAKTPMERDMEKKGTIERTYGQSVTPDLVARHDEGIYPKMRLHYYLTIGRERLGERDLKVVQMFFERNEGKIWNPDLVRDTYSQKVYALDIIGMKQFLDPDATFTKDSLQEWAERIQGWKKELRIIFGTSLNDRMSPIQIAQLFLSYLGLRLFCVAHKRVPGERHRQRIYKLSVPQDRREEIFTYWQQQHQSKAGETAEQQTE